MYHNYEYPKSLDWQTKQEQAKHMSNEQLTFAIQDCTEAAKAAYNLQQNGHHVTKTQGYYRKERSVYSAELRRRENEIHYFIEIVINLNDHSTKRSVHILKGYSKLQALEHINDINTQQLCQPALYVSKAAMLTKAQYTLFIHQHPSGEYFSETW